MKLNSRAVGSMSAVAALPTELQLISDSQDVASIREHIGEEASGYDAFFVYAKDGEYVEVWAMCGIIPRNTKLVTRLL